MQALSPLDGRYEKLVGELRASFSEEALMKARVEVEAQYLIALSGVREIRELKLLERHKSALLKLLERFSERDIIAIRALEKKTKHDVKAVEYFLRGKVRNIPGMRNALSFIHFGLTSEDVNNLAYGMLIHRALKEVIRPQLRSLLAQIGSIGRRYAATPLLALTHGQPATETTLGKEFFVFMERLGKQLSDLYGFRMSGKFGGAVGTLAAHRAAYPRVRWNAFARTFVRSLGLRPLRYTTQINPHDDLAELSHLLSRINTILLDLSRDVWLYISRGVFVQRTKPGEVGSSTMPHKVNPIDFENAEGNLGLSTALFLHFAEKLPVSRLQRDLSDSTVQRNLGVAFGHHLIAVKALQQGLSKIRANRAKMFEEIEAHPEAHAEAIQTVMRKCGYLDAYEQLKKMTRGKEVTREKLQKFVEELRIPKEDKKRLLALF
jgi:adenylosuccinate lyase